MEDHDSTFVPTAASVPRTGRHPSETIAYAPSMDLRIFTEPQQGAGHGTLLAAAHATRDAGFSAFFRSDHVLAMGSGGGLPGPSDSVASLAALAASVPDIRFGTLVTSATFRHPSMLAIATAHIDDISGGRIELGLGSGWFADEHTAYGLPFGSSFGERFDRLTEQLEIITGLWDTPVGSTFDYPGAHYQLAGAPGLPKPVQVGRDRDAAGADHRRRPRAEADAGAGRPVRRRVQRRILSGGCQPHPARPGPRSLHGRRPRSDLHGLFDRAPGLLRRRRCRGHPPGDRDRPDRRTAARRTAALVGTPAELVDQLGTWAEIGADRAYLQVLDLADLDHIAFLGAEVLPQVRG